MKSKISEIIQKTAKVLYTRGLSMFDAEMQQHLISTCALGKVSELYENEELKNEAAACFLDGWFRAKKTDMGEVDLLECENCRPTLISGEYLIFIFYGIGMKEENASMKNFADIISTLLKKINPDNKVYIHHVASFDDSRDANRFNDSLFSDAVSVVMRAYMPNNSKTQQFSHFVEKECKKHPDAKLILIGYSGGGVMVTEIEENLKKKNVRAADKIIRIGSPELKVSEKMAKKTVNIIIPGDPVPIISFMREKDDTKLNNHYLLNVKYPSKNPIEVHSLYFSADSDGLGITNCEKTALACINYIK